MAMPRITVVTPSYNQGRFIARTIDSVRDQGYPNLEHIVVDGMSRDETDTILARYTHLRVIREPDRGQAEAINKGFQRATGDIFCFLNSDDTLLPGAFDRVAREIDPSRGRHIVMGRCCHIDEHDRLLPLEHPSAFLGHRRILEVWKVHSIPQPATFWTAEVWRRCGPLNEREQMVPDYDLFCRFSRHYRFHFIDQVLATYRLHSESKTCTREDADVLREAIRVSRRYWGPVWRPQFWQLLGSLACYRLDQVLQHKLWAAAFTSEFERAKRRGNLLLALANLAGAAACSPTVAFRRAMLPQLGRYLDRWLPTDTDLWRPERCAPATLAWRGFTGQHVNGCIGPTFVTHFQTNAVHSVLELLLDGVLQPLPWPIRVAAYLDGGLAHRCCYAARTPLLIRLPLTDMTPGWHELRVTSSTYVVPHEHLGNGDFRPLALKLKRLRQVPIGVKDQRRVA
jgi:glycosyltransferase involved in cell wall biosynthesis